MNRIYAVFLKNIYHLRGSLPRQAQFIFWPMLNIFIWGFMAIFIGSAPTWGMKTFSVIIGTVLLSDLFFYTQVGICMPYMEELWGRTIGNLTTSPITDSELALSFVVVGIFRCLFGIAIAAVIAYGLFHFSILEAGPSLVAFFGVLIIFGSGVGLMIASMLTRYGMGADFLVWPLAAVIAPLSGFVYPISVFPPLLQKISLALPSTYVFEGMRQALINNYFDWNGFYKAMALSFVYLAIGLFVFCDALKKARISGRLTTIASE